MQSGLTLFIRSTGDPAALTTVMRDRIRSIDADIPTTITTFESVVSASVADRRFTMLVLTAFGSFAERRRVLGMILSDGLRAVVPGIVVGVVGALLLSRLMSSLLYGIAPTDPMTFSAVVLVLVA